MISLMILYYIIVDLYQSYLYLLERKSILITRNGELCKPALMCFLFISLSLYLIQAQYLQIFSTASDSDDSCQHALKPASFSYREVIRKICKIVPDR
jgi:hypothetical protein